MGSDRTPSAVLGMEAWSPVERHLPLSSHPRCCGRKRTNPSIGSGSVKQVTRGQGGPTSAFAGEGRPMPSAQHPTIKQ